MKSKILNVTWLLISMSCICGMCSKDNHTNDAGNNSNDPVLAPDATWVYVDECPTLISFYPNNNRPFSEKWVATKIPTAIWGYSGTNPSFFVWNFENTGDTRFLQNAGNPGGREVLSISLTNVSRAPAPGSYQMDIDYKKGFCWYYVYNSSGGLHDSTRVQGLDNSTFTITSITFDKAVIPTVDRYKMSGTATFNIFFWANGTSSTTDIHTLKCSFNNVPVDVTQ